MIIADAVCIRIAKQVVGFSATALTAHKPNLSAFRMPKQPVKIPPGMDEEALVMLSDIFPTGYECGVLNGKIQPGGTVAIVGSGPIGLAALLTAQFLSPRKLSWSIWMIMARNRETSGGDRDDQ